MRKENDFIKGIKSDVLKSVGLGNAFGNDLVVGIGDDAAVIDRGDKYELISTDMFVEADHFRLDWFSDQQVGMKVIECSVSDIFAMGGVPKYVFVSVCVPGKFSGGMGTNSGGIGMTSGAMKNSGVGMGESFLNNLYEGILKTCKKYNAILAGGDTTHGEKIVIDVVVVGEVAKDRLCLRSGAKVGDKICVTGNLGNGAAGLSLFEKDGQEAKWSHEYATVVRKYLEPAAQGTKGPLLAKYVSAMIDVSDGIGSEIRHICDQTNEKIASYDAGSDSVRNGGDVSEVEKRGILNKRFVSARIYADKIPMHDEAVFVSTYVKKNALKFALSGGEDFELMFTISSKNLEKMKSELKYKENDDFYVIGDIVATENVGGGNTDDSDLKAVSDPVSDPVLVQDGVETRLPGGYDHFS